MNELYCIKTHSQGVVVKGNLYPLLGIGGNCICNKDCIDVGIKSNMISIQGNKLSIGQLVRCGNCERPYTEDGIHWICPTLFANIDNISLEEIEILGKFMYIDKLKKY